LTRKKPHEQNSRLVDEIAQRTGGKDLWPDILSNPEKLHQESGYTSEGGVPFTKN
jgi:hypothetical protein